MELRADVVLQPYHPIVQSGTYANWFPHARRFVYVNPTAVDRVRCSDVTDAMVFHDPDDPWGLPRLRFPDHLAFAVNDALAIARRPGVHGVFVDDLDRMLTTPFERAVAVAYVRTIAASTGAALYINRAFTILDDLDGVEAVLVEDIDRNAESPDAIAWLNDVVLPVLTRARQRGVRVHALGYDADPAGRTAGIESLLAAVTTSSARLPHPRLDEWCWWSAGTTLHTTRNVR